MIIDLRFGLDVSPGARANLLVLRVINSPKQWLRHQSIRAAQVGRRDWVAVTREASLIPEGPTSEYTTVLPKEHMFIARCDYPLDQVTTVAASVCILHGAGNFPFSMGSVSMNRLERVTFRNRAAVTRIEIFRWPPAEKPGETAPFWNRLGMEFEA